MYSGPGTEKTVKEFATFCRYYQTIHALLRIGHGHKNKENIDAGTGKFINTDMGRQRPH